MIAEKNSPETDWAAGRGTLRTVLITLGLCGIGLIVLYLLRSFATALLVIFAGILFGVFLHGVSMLLAKWLRLSRQLALAVAVLLLLIVCGAFIWLAGPANCAAKPIAHSAAAAIRQSAAATVVTNRLGARRSRHAAVARSASAFISIHSRVGYTGVLHHLGYHWRSRFHLFRGAISRRQA